MELTLGDVISRATTLAGGRSDFSGSEVSFYANLAAEEIAVRILPQELSASTQISISSGATQITPPTDYAYTMALSHLTAVGLVDPRLSRMEPEWFDSRDTYPGIPSHYGDFGSWLEVWPKSDSTYSMHLRYQTRHTTLVSSSSTPFFPERYHVAWLHKTSTYCAQARGDFEAETVANGRYLNAINSVPSPQEYRQQEEFGVRLKRFRGR